MLRQPNCGTVCPTRRGPDHFGESDIDSAHEPAERKLVVARAVTSDAGRAGLPMLNADDAVLPAAAAAGKTLFSHQHDHPALVAGRLGGSGSCGAGPAGMGGTG